ncbi:hypothetical protein GWI33_016433 [Rhynchophorus ferrugineus]|uniref:Uncharacterized protein n=1 Tax=Rhynchophorus ferrugineus TaxID=354439 RepID=A0A834I1C7_RHYFE|nr:hypothetical protein GWI33_016433 [Rhynchophorus ferrugineus]
MARPELSSSLTKLGIISLINNSSITGFTSSSHSKRSPFRQGIDRNPLTIQTVVIKRVRTRSAIIIIAVCRGSLSLRPRARELFRDCYGYRVAKRLEFVRSSGPDLTAATKKLRYENKRNPISNWCCFSWQEKEL